MDSSSLLHSRECPVCYEAFSTAHVPLRFPCAHRCCSECVPLIEEEKKEEEEARAELVYLLMDDGLGNVIAIPIPIGRRNAAPSTATSPTIRCPLCRGATRREDIKEDQQLLESLSAPSPPSPPIGQDVEGNEGLPLYLGS